MKVALCGGGDFMHIEGMNRLYSEIAEKNKPVLYIPLASEQEDFSHCSEWINNQLNQYGINTVETICSIDELSNVEPALYSSIFIGGGNTYKLLKLLKESGVYNKIQDYINNDGIIIGSSAGAVIFGEDIDSISYMDDNNVNWQETKGFNILNNYSICPHFTNANEERNAFEYDWIINYVKSGNKVIAIPEESALVVENDKITVLGNKPCVIFNENIKSVEPGAVFKL